MDSSHRMADKQFGFMPIIYLFLENIGIPIWNVCVNCSELFPRDNVLFLILIILVNTLIIFLLMWRNQIRRVIYVYLHVQDIYNAHKVEREILWFPSWEEGDSFESIFTSRFKWICSSMYILSSASLSEHCPWYFFSSYICNWASTFLRQQPKGMQSSIKMNYVHTGNRRGHCWPGYISEVTDTLSRYLHQVPTHNNEKRYVPSHLHEEENILL